MREETKREIERARGELQQAQDRLARLEQRLEAEEREERTRELEKRGLDWLRSFLEHGLVRSAQVAGPDTRTGHTWTEDYELVTAGGCVMRVHVERPYHAGPCTLKGCTTH